MMLYGQTHFRSFRINSIELRLSAYDTTYTWDYGATVSSEMNFTYHPVYAEANVAGDPSNPYTYYYNATTANANYINVTTGNYYIDYNISESTISTSFGNANE